MIPGPRLLSRTGLRLSPAGLGGVPLGEIYERIDESRAEATLDAA